VAGLPGAGRPNPRRSPEATLACPDAPRDGLHLMPRET
jgi:hypothetical protein